MAVTVTAFATLAEPTRQRILDQLRASESSVGGLVDSLRVSQPTVSKHLKVLRDAGFVSCRTAAQQRIYRLETQQFEAVDQWLEPYRRRWARHLDALERHLDSLPIESEQHDMDEE
jgi:DNA-binding transcriptional ArsR family regulator